VLDAITFYFFGALAVISAILVVTRRNAVHSAIFLVTALLATAGIFLGLGAQFLFIVQVILYVGGIMVLFIFVIMLVNLDVSVRQMQFNRMWVVALALAVALGAQIFMVFHYARSGVGDTLFQFPPAPVEALEPNSELVGQALFSQYMLPFEIASVLLLVAMVGAVVMAKRKV
jgi:NADH-quinone oxidoreductase subunit J